MQRDRFALPRLQEQWKARKGSVGQIPMVGEIRKSFLDVGHVCSRLEQDIGIDFGPNPRIIIADQILNNVWKDIKVSESRWEFLGYFSQGVFFPKEFLRHRSGYHDVAGLTEGRISIARDQWKGKDLKKY